MANKERKKNENDKKNVSIYNNLNQNIKSMNFNSFQGLTHYKQNKYNLCNQENAVFEIILRTDFMFYI